MTPPSPPRSTCRHPSSPSIRIPFESLASLPLFQTLMEATHSIISNFDRSPTELADLLTASLSLLGDLLAFPSPSLPQLRQRCDAGAAHLALLRQLAETLLETPKLDFSSPAVISLPAGVADSLARLVSDHLPAVTSVGLLPRLLDSLVRLLRTTAGMPGTAGLVVSALNELFVNAGEIPRECVAATPAVIAALAQNAALPQEWFEQPKWPAEEAESSAEKHRLRQACQDVVLAMADDVGVREVATAIIAVKGSLAAEESAACLLCGVVDAIEEMALPLFSAGVGEEDSRGGKRTDIPSYPLETPYDEVMEYIAGEMGRFARHPLLLSTGLQLLFDFDNWTFSRRELCERLFDFLVEAMGRSANGPLLPRLFSYLARLYEAPVFQLSPQNYQRLRTLASSMALMASQSMTSLSPMTSTVSTVSTMSTMSSMSTVTTMPTVPTMTTMSTIPTNPSMSTMSSMTTMSTIPSTPTMSSIPTMSSMTTMSSTPTIPSIPSIPSIPTTSTTSTTPSLIYHLARLLATSASYLPPRDIPSHLQQLLPPLLNALTAGNLSQRSLALHAAAGILDGSLATDCANAATAEILPQLHPLLQHGLPAGREVLVVLAAAVHACDAQISPDNAREVVAITAGMLTTPLRREALEVLDALVAAAFHTIPAEQRGALLAASNEMLTWIVSNGHVQEEVDTVKLLLRLQYTFLKEESERMGNREVIANVTGLLVGIIQGMVNEEELIRIVIRSLLFLVNVAVIPPSHL